MDRGTPKAAAGVYFIDFGNTEVVNVADVRPMEAALAAVAPLATAAQLAYVRVPDLSDAEWGESAAEVLSEIVGGGLRFKTQVRICSASRLCHCTNQGIYAHSQRLARKLHEVLYC